MCYDISTNLEAQLSRASRKLDLRTIKEIKENLAPLVDGYFGGTMPLISVKQCHFKRYCNYIKN